MITKRLNNKLQKSIGVALLVMSGAASAALPPVVDAAGNTVATAANPSAGVVGMYNKLQRLQVEVQQLRGQVEEQAYTIESLKKRQRDLYLDTDRRMRALEAGKSVALTTQGGVTNLSVPVLAEGGQSINKTGISAPEAVDMQAAVVQDKQAYNAAFATLKAGRYTQAIEGFSNFVKVYPNSLYLPNALYWLGEANYVTRDFNGALTEFDKVVKQYSSHSKAKDALLKIGFIQYENKQWAQARATLQRVTSSYSGTTVAKLAQQRLERMLKEKH